MSKRKMGTRGEREGVSPSAPELVVVAIDLHPRCLSPHPRDTQPLCDFAATLLWTHSARSLDQAKKQNDAHTAILSELMTRPENRTCADCNEKGNPSSLWSTT